VDNIDTVFEQLLCGNFKWGIAFFHETTRNAIFGVGEL
jgi:hypothetical protein